MKCAEWTLSGSVAGGFKRTSNYCCLFFLLLLLFPCSARHFCLTLQICRLSNETLCSKTRVDCKSCVLKRLQLKAGPSWDHLERSRLLAVEGRIAAETEITLVTFLDVYFAEGKELRYNPSPPIWNIFLQSSRECKLHARRTNMPPLIRPWPNIVLCLNGYSIIQTMFDLGQLPSLQLLPPWGGL